MCGLAMGRGGCCSLSPCPSVSVDVQMSRVIALSTCADWLFPSLTVMGPFLEYHGMIYELGWGCYDLWHNYYALCTLVSIFLLQISLQQSKPRILINVVGIVSASQS